MESCVFCRIVAGRAQAHVVFENETTMAFLDILPLFHGHTLLVPKAHYETLADLPDALIAPLFANARRLAAAVQAGTSAEGSLMLMNNTVSQSVPHFHLHLIPRRFGDGLRGFLWPRVRYDDETQASSVAEAIRAEYHRTAES